MSAKSATLQTVSLCLILINSIESFTLPVPGSCRLLVYYPRERLCRADVEIFEVIALVPFENAFYALSGKQGVRLAYPVADRRRNGIARFLFPVAEAEIYRACPDLILLHKVRKAREPDRRGRRRDAAEKIRPVRRPQGKKPGE